MGKIVRLWFPEHRFIVTIFAKCACGACNIQIKFRNLLDIDPYNMTIDPNNMTIDPYNMTVDPYNMTIDPYNMTIDPYNMLIICYKKISICAFSKKFFLDF